MSDHNFNTPPWFLDLVRRLSPKRKIGLDPCGNKWSYVNAATTYTEETNGLIHPWRGHGLTFVNPPHSMSPYNIEPWIAKAIEEFITQPIERELGYPEQDQFVGLVPSKSGPQWFHSIIDDVDGRCFWRGRIKFWEYGHEAEGAGKFDSLVLYIGPQAGNFHHIFNPYGWVV